MLAGRRAGSRKINAGRHSRLICFPTLCGLAGRYSSPRTPNSAGPGEAYNDWHVEEGCGAYPAGFIPDDAAVIWEAESLREGGEGATTNAECTR